MPLLYTLLVVKEDHIRPAPLDGAKCPARAQRARAHVLSRPFAKAAVRARHPNGSSTYRGGQLMT